VLASPSTVRPFWFSKFMRAPLVMTFSAPSIHSDVSEDGWFGHRQANVPTWAVVASAGELRGADGVNVNGR